MLVPQIALPHVPRHARVTPDALSGVLQAMATTPAELQHALDRGFRTMEQNHPALAEYLSLEVFEVDHRSAQGILYYVAVAIYLSFTESFGPRLGWVSSDDIRSLVHRLLLDGELRDTGHGGDTYSEDLVALAQPALCDFARAEVEQPQDNPDAEPPPIPYGVILVEILALSLAVAAPLRRPASEVL